MNNLHRHQSEKAYKNDGQDDIQEIILQAQKVYKESEQYHDTQHSDEFKGADHRSTDSKESPQPKKQHAIYQNLEPKIMNNQSSRSKSPTEVFRDQDKVTKRSNTQQTNRGSEDRMAKKTRNHVLNSNQNSGSDGLYVDTNLDNEQVRNYTPEPFTQPGPILNTSLTGLNDYHKFAQLKDDLDFNQNVTKLPQIKPYRNDQSHNNDQSTNPRNGHMDFPPPKIQTSHSNERRVESKHLESSRSMQPRGKKEISPINKYRIRRLEKSANCRQQQSSEHYRLTDQLSKSRSNPSKTSSVENLRKPPQVVKEFKKQVSMLNRKSQVQSSASLTHTQFSQNFSMVYDKITELYPGFTKIATSDSIHPQLMPDDLLRAENVFNQLNYMYERAVEKAVPKGDVHNETGNFGAQAHNHANSLSALEFKLQNADRESHYYQNQLTVFKEQLQSAALREQQQEASYEKRLEFLNQQVKDYEARVDKMQDKLEQYQKGMDRDTQSQVSFRDTKQAISFKSWTNQETSNYQLTADNRPDNRDLDAKFSQMMSEVSELKARLKSRDDQLTFEKDNNGILMEKINRMNEAFESELTTYKKECNLLQDEIRHRDSQMNTYKQQVEMVSQTANLEFPIVIARDSEEKDSNNINLSNQRANAQQTKKNKFINMRKTTKNAILEEFDLDIDQIMEAGDFENDEIQLITQSFKGKNQKRLKSNGRAGKSPQPSKQKQKQSAFSQNIMSMFSLNDAYKSQITSVLAADEVLKDMKKTRKDQLDKITASLDSNKRHHEKVEAFTQQKEELASKLKELTNENESLKHQFSQLLDQFQEYVNESERKLEEDQYNQKAHQEQLLNDLNNTVQQLEEMSKQLQQEVQDKERQIERMEEEHNQQSKELQDLRQQSQQLVGSEETQRAQVKTLTDDLRYMKKQYQMEIEALRGENIHLQQQHLKIKDKSTDFNNNRRLQPQRSTSPYDNEEVQPQMDKKYEESVIDAPEYSQFAESRPNRQSNSQMIDYSKSKRQGSNTSNRDYPQNHRDNRWREQDEELQDTIYGGKEAIRSKSYDRVLTGNDHASQQPKGTSFDLRSPSYEEKKREMLDKDRLIEQKNQEIVKLRMDNDELRDFCQNGVNDETKKKSRQQIYDEIGDFLENVHSELEKTKLNLFNKERSYSPQMRNFREQRNFTLVQTEDALLSALFEKTQLMRNIKALLGEVSLLSSQQRQYLVKPNHKFQNNSGVQPGMMKISEQEYQKMLQENSQLERMISHYEQTLEKFEVVNQNSDDQAALLELKRIQQQQLQTINMLQSENNILQEQMSHQENQGAPNNSMQKMQQESRVLRQEIQMLREVEIRAQNLKNGNDELMHERNQLLQKIDGQEQLQSDLNMQAQDSQLQMADRDAQLEELRTRITTIAELFEKKPIKQRYSFEVLCDFVHDKAKRLFAKYESAVKEKKVLQNDDKNGRKIYKLEQEIHSMREHTKFLKQTVLPSLATLLNKESHDEDDDQFNLQLARQLLLEVEYEFKQQRKELHDNSQTIQSNLQKIDSLQRALDQVNAAAYRISPNRARGTSQDDQLRTMKQEKEQLNQKLDEFSQVLRDFQVNQKKFEQENSQLKTKIAQLEGNQTSLMDNYSNKHGTNLMTSLNCAEPSIAAASGHSGYARRNDHLASSKGLHGFNHTNVSTTTQNHIPGATALAGEASPMKHNP